MDEKRVVVVMSNKNRRYTMVDVSNYKIVHKSGFHKDGHRCLLRAVTYANKHGLLIQAIVHV